MRYNPVFVVKRQTQRALSRNAKQRRNRSVLSFFFIHSTASLETAEMPLSGYAWTLNEALDVVKQVEKLRA